MVRKKNRMVVVKVLIIRIILIISKTNKTQTKCQNQEFKKEFTLNQTTTVTLMNLILKEEELNLHHSKMEHIMKNQVR
jgi:hypothetical protein